LLWAAPIPIEETHFVAASRVTQISIFPCMGDRAGIRGIEKVTRQQAVTSLRLRLAEAV
jgi:hypothetical protein